MIIKDYDLSHPFIEALLFFNSIDLRVQFYLARHLTQDQFRDLIIPMHEAYTKQVPFKRTSISSFEIGLDLKYQKEFVLSKRKDNSLALFVAGLDIIPNRKDDPESIEFKPFTDDYFKSYSNESLFELLEFPQDYRQYPISDLLFHILDYIPLSDHIGMKTL